MAGPFLKWAGGKTYLLPRLRLYYPHSFETYFEPFLGGGAVFFDLRPKSAILSDSNEDLIIAYQTVRRNVDSLIRSLTDLAAEYRKSPKEKYYEVRDHQDPAELDAVSRTARLIFLNKTCYNGLYRVNAQGHFNVPFGNYRNPTICDEEGLQTSSDALQSAVIRAMDYHEALRLVRTGDFVYLDPPYHPVSKTASFTRYTREDFGQAEQLELASELSKLRGTVDCKILLSNAKVSHIESMYRRLGFDITLVTAPRMISCKPETRGKILEILVRNY